MKKNHKNRTSLWAPKKSFETEKKKKMLKRKAFFAHSEPLLIFFMKAWKEDEKINQIIYIIRDDLGIF